MDDYVVVGAYSSEMEADLVVQRLAGVGIHATTRSDNVGGMFPSMELATGGVEVLVPESRRSDAQRALNLTDRAPSSRQRRRVEQPQPTDRGRVVRRMTTVAVFLVLIVVVLAAMLSFLDNPLP